MIISGIKSVKRAAARAAVTAMLVVAGSVAPAGAASEAGAEAAIAWRSFDRTAFETARQENKLVLLYLSTPWGHWDRVMSDLTFADPRVIRMVSEKFVPVKVEADLRPDIDLRYGMGGWPAIAFVLASGQPFYQPDSQGKISRAGGTYYAPEALIEYLTALADYFEANRETAEKAADEIATALLSRKDVAKGEVTQEIVEVAVTSLMSAYGDWWPDPRIKRASHPDGDSIELGFYYYHLKGNESVLEVSLRLLTEMARGGIRDHLGGGFHRYAIDSAWRVPAFEKTLSVNAEMLRAYGDAYGLTGGERYRTIAEGIAGYLMDTLRTPAGWFRSWQAADARIGEDGDYYTWTLDEVNGLLSEEERTILIPAYDIREWGDLVNTAPRRNVLFLYDGPHVLSRRLGIEQDKANALFESGRRKLIEARSRRTAPPAGDVVLVDANASAAAALIDQGDLWKRQDLRQAGLDAVEFLWAQARDPESGLMDHVWRPDGGRGGLPTLFADQAQMTRALLSAYESTGETRHLDRALGLARAAAEAFEDSLDGGYADRIFSAQAPGLLSWPSRVIRDNALFADCLLRLHHLSLKPASGDLMKLARRAIESWADEYAGYRESASGFGLAAAHLIHAPVEVIVAGDPSDEGYAELDAEARALYHPWKLTRHLERAAAAKRAETGVAAEGRPVVVFCLANRCDGPHEQVDALRAAFARFNGPATEEGETEAQP